MNKPSTKKQITNRRREVIRNKLEEFLSEPLRFYPGRHRYDVSEVFGPKEFLEMARLYLDQRDNLEVIFSYARRYKQAVEEMSEEDVEIVFKRLSVLQITKQ